MKTKTKSIVKLIALALLALSTLNYQLSTAFGQGTAFTYQGRLNAGGSPASGLYDFRFRLDADPAGNTILDTVTTNAVGVTNGLFLATIDFGPGFYNGSNYWLEVDVKTNLAGSYIQLSPFQSLTPAPYAVFAITASNVSGTISAAQLPTVVVTNGGSGTSLTGVALLVGGNNFTGNQTVTGTVQVNGPEQITGASGTGFHADENIGPNTYFSGEEHGINFNYGSGANQNIGSMIMGWNGQGYFSVGNLYGSWNGTGKAFTVFGNGNVNVDPMGMNSGFLNNGNTNGSGLTFGVGSGEGIASQRQTGLGGNNVNGLDFYTGFTTKMSILNDGFVGIGTQTQILGDEQFGMYSSTSNNFSGMYIGTAAGGRPFYGFYEGGYPSVSWTEINGQQSNNWELWLNNSFKMAVTTNGNVGIGTTTPSSALEVANGPIRTDGNALLCTSIGSSLSSDGLYNGTLGLPNSVGINEGEGPGLWGYYGGSLGALAPNTIALSWDTVGDIWVSNNCSVATLTSRYGANIDQANLNSGSVSGNALTFGLSSGEGIGSQRTGGSTGNGLDGLEFYTSFARRMTILQDGNVGIGSTNPANLLVVGGATSPAYCNGTSWVNGSDRNSKQDFATVNPRDVLEKVSALPITEWQYKVEPGEEHIGPMAQDFHAAFGLNGGDDKHISTVDEGGVALAAIQGLNQKLQEKDAKIQQQAKEIAELQQQFAELNFLVKQLVQPHSK
jgi:hypothetical protein